VEFYRQLGTDSVLRVDRLGTLIPDAEEPLLSDCHLPIRLHARQRMRVHLTGTNI
jgi:hypothetical protein